MFVLYIVVQYKGGSTTGEKGEKLFEELTKLFPPGSVTGEGLRKVQRWLRVLLKPGREPC